MPCAKFQSDRLTEAWLMGKRDFARFEFKMNVGRISYIAQGPRLKKRDTHLITYSSGGDSTQIDHIHYPKSFGSAVSNVEVIPKGECVKQHYMVVCNFSAHTPMGKNFKFSPHIITWKLRDPGPWFNIKMTSYQYRKFHCGDKTILRPSYLHNGISHTDKMTSLYWIKAQVLQAWSSQSSR